MTNHAHPKDADRNRTRSKTNAPRNEEGRNKQKPGKSHIFAPRAVPSGKITLTYPSSHKHGEPPPGDNAAGEIITVCCEGECAYGILWSGALQGECSEPDGSVIIHLTGGLTLDSRGNRGSPVLKALNLYPLTIRFGEDVYVVALAEEAVLRIKAATDT